MGSADVQAGWLACWRNRRLLHGTGRFVEQGLSGRECDQPRTPVYWIASRTCGSVPRSARRWRERAGTIRCRWYWWTSPDTS